MSAGGKRRALGQHFLRDSAIARAIVDLVAPTPADLVVEIGPGEGALTPLLAARAGRFLAIEVDPVLAGRLQDRFDVRLADARTFEYRSLAAADGRVLVVGNLPYSVAKPILLRLDSARDAIDEMALMLQKEVAERLAASPGGRSYGSLSVLTQLYWDVRVALSVPPGAFRPPPLVDSAVVHMKARPGPAVAVVDEGCLRRVVVAAFSQRRKALANALAAGLHVPVATARDRLRRAGIDPGRRAETLSLAEFARLAAEC
jgi:16S rRNA (adenine1518-N6/adenine1519-N6)-dimethyltransferase